MMLSGGVAAVSPSTQPGFREAANQAERVNFGRGQALPVRHRRRRAEPGRCARTCVAELWNTCRSVPGAHVAPSFEPASGSRAATTSRRG